MTPHMMFAVRMLFILAAVEKILMMRRKMEGRGDATG